jgi:5-(carboxyamino)imidazole ribonucleotide mutase
VATVGINKSENAALLAAQILATSNEDIAIKLEKLREERVKKVKTADEKIMLIGPQAHLDTLKKS